MTTIENAARQALEALKSSRVFVTTREKIKHPEGTEAYDEIVEALRQALDQPVQEPVAWKCPDCGADQTFNHRGCKFINTTHKEKNT